MLPDLSNAELLRYSRHLLIPDVGLEGQKKLKAASVLVVGTGGLGSPIALYLTAAGIGTIGIVDYDVVEQSNLQRQVIHSTEKVGSLKVESAGERLIGLNPFIKIETYNEVFSSKNAFEISDGYDILIDGTDNFPTRYLLNDLAVLTKRPYIYGSIFRFEGQVSVFDAKTGPCYRCLFPTPPPPGLAPSCSEGGVFGVLPGTIGSIQATEAIKLILGIGEPLTGKLLLYDASDLSFQIVKLHKNPDCKICGPSPEIHDLINYEEFCGVPTLERPHEFGETDIFPVDLQAKLLRGEIIQLVDVRSAVELQVSSIPGAILIPLERLAERLNELDKNHETVLFCRTGSRARRAQQILKRNGFINVRNLFGGINAWARDVDPETKIY